MLAPAWGSTDLAKGRHGHSRPGRQLLGRAPQSAHCRVIGGEGEPRSAEIAGALPAGTALDLGCGAGGDALWLAARGRRVTAVDITAVSVRAPAASHPAPGDTAATDLAASREANAAANDESASWDDLTAAGPRPAGHGRRAPARRWALGAGPPDHATRDTRTSSGNCPTARPAAAPGAG
ncbi:class I SAM-dependent methyltransferase [Streptomyces huasconensis]|uniref:class I SAM-dependent methyltransferase n=1 Tax=Streptomyces huasconensis TaxID=1854574 RepID=UPI0036FD348F